MNLSAAQVSTPVGPLTVVVDDDMVMRAMGFAEDPAVLTRRLPAAPPRLRADLGEVSVAARAYVDGDLTAWDALPVAQPGGPFLQEAWRRMRAVPAGQTVTYTELAALSGRPDAIRAAAMACARNQVAPVIPCHRVLRKDGTLGGYYWGLPVKQWLLAHEAKHAAA